MNKLLLLIIGFCLSLYSFGAIQKVDNLKMPVVHSSQVNIYIINAKQHINLLDLATIKRKEFEKLTGKKMNFFEKLSFSVLQRKLRVGIDKKGYISNQKIKRLLNTKTGDSTFHAGGFFLGFFGSWMGVIAAHLIRDEKKKRRQKWAWIGFGCSFIAVALIIFTGIVFL